MKDTYKDIFWELHYAIEEIMKHNNVLSLDGKFFEIGKIIQRAQGKADELDRETTGETKTLLNEVTGGGIGGNVLPMTKYLSVEINELPVHSILWFHPNGEKSDGVSLIFTGYPKLIEKLKDLKEKLENE